MADYDDKLRELYNHKDIEIDVNSEDQTNNINDDNKDLDSEESSQENKDISDIKNKICFPNKYNPSTGNFLPFLTKEMEDMIKNLKIDSLSHKISNDNSNNTLVAVIDCLLKYHYDKDFENLKTFFYEFNQKLCENPLENEEMEELWDQQTDFIEIVSGDDDEKEIRQDDFTISYYDIYGEHCPEFKSKLGSNSNIHVRSNVNNYDTTISDVDELRSKPIYKVVEHESPYKVYYIDDRLGQICFGVLKGSDIFPSKSIIDIAPKKLTYFNNPIFPKAEPKVQLEFSDGLKYILKKLGPCNNIHEVLKILENDGYILNKSKAHDAFNSIVSAMKENKGLVEYIEDVTTSGYYLVKDSIVKKDITQRKNVSKEDAEKCCLLLDKLAEEGWVNKNIFPTVLKWAILATFNFVIKQLDKNNFIPWLMLYGKSKSGKSTLGEISNKIWRLRDNDKGFSSIDTPPKLGQVLSQTTYPILINEVGVLSTNNIFGKYNSLIEMMKSSITGITARSKFVSYSTYTDIPALCPLILTSNYKIIEDSGFLRRFIAIHFPDVEEKSTEQQENFNSLDLEILGVLGDFISQNISIYILKEDWKMTSKELLKKFYKFAGREEEQYLSG